MKLKEKKNKINSSYSFFGLLVLALQIYLLFIRLEHPLPTVDPFDL